MAAARGSGQQFRPHPQPYPDPHPAPSTTKNDSDYLPSAPCNGNPAALVAGCRCYCCCRRCCWEPSEARRGHHRARVSSRLPPLQLPESCRSALGPYPSLHRFTSGIAAWNAKCAVIRDTNNLRFPALRPRASFYSPPRTSAVGGGGEGAGGILGGVKKPTQFPHRCHTCVVLTGYSPAAG